MARITVVGSGVTGMAIAKELSRNHKITIVARNLPGDEPSIEWASPWAGAIFVAGGCSSARERKMQLDSYAELQRLAVSHPESSARFITLEDVYEHNVTQEDIWWRNAMPEFRFLTSSELPPSAKAGISYKTVVLNPNIFLPWFRLTLEALGVEFQRKDLTALSEACVPDAHVLINATGVGSHALTDVNDQKVQSVRGQTIVVRSDYAKTFMRDSGKDYTYAIPRLDGTVILGGIKEVGSTDPAVNWEQSKDIVRRLHESLPQSFSSNIADYQILGHNVGIRPSRSSGIRLEKDVRSGRRIVHAYGFSGGGYIHGFGAAGMVSDLVEELLLDSKLAKL